MKLTTNDIIMHLEDGAILNRVNAIYNSYWYLLLKDGRKIYCTQMRKNAVYNAKAKIKYDIIAQDKNGYSIKIKN
jgi:hypothetical protein